MPELCRFHGMVIKLIYGDIIQHNKPHIHVYCAEYEASVGIDGELLAGSLDERWKLMYIIDDIAYAGESPLSIKVISVRALNDYKLWLRFSTGEEKEFDFQPLLDYPCYKPLRDEKLFKEVYIDYGVTVWNDGDIDIAPDNLYENSILITNQ